MNRLRVFLALVGVVFFLWVRVQGATPAVFSHGLRGRPEVALTFDDGPHPLYTPLLLEILRQHQARATFFVVGKRVKQYPGLLDRITREDQELGNHSFSHTDMRSLTREEVSRELSRTSALTEGWAGVKLHLFRPPGGQYNGKVMECARRQGYTMVLWTLNPADWKMPQDKILEKIENTVRGGDIILLHDGAIETIKALPEILSILKTKGLNCVTVGWMIQKWEEQRSASQTKQEAAQIKKELQGKYKDGHPVVKSDKPDKGALEIYHNIEQDR